MGIINRSYDVLSDQAQRKAHDGWIEEAERREMAASESKSDFDRARSRDPRSETTKSVTPRGNMHSVLKHIGRYFFFYAGVCLAFAFWLIPSSPPRPSGLAPYNESPNQTWENVSDSDPLANAFGAAPADEAQPAPEKAFVRPKLAPNGSPWPTQAAYINDYPKLRAAGLSEVTIDNSSNGSDVFVKLVAIDASETFPVRHAFIPAYGQFTMRGVDAGTYDVRYMDLGDGGLSRSESFDLEEIEEPGGVRYSRFTMTLYKVANGNMDTYPLNPSEF